MWIGRVAYGESSHFYKHGKKGTSIYKCWQDMKARCNNINNQQYHDYGGRGIKVCDEWNNNFEQFYKDMGDREEGMQIDRIDVNGNYCKENCRWVTASVNARNKRKRSGTTSKYIGVSWNKQYKKWRAQLRVGDKTIDLGYFDIEEEASKIYQDYIKKNGLIQSYWKSLIIAPPTVPVIAPIATYITLPVKFLSKLSSCCT